jgi:RHS repeat-associated protein
VRAISYSWLSIILLLVCTATRANAQNFPYNADTKAARGIAPNAYLLDGQVDRVDPVSGNLHIEVPLASLPKGDAGSGFNLSLVYNSHLYDFQAGEYPIVDGFLYSQTLVHQFVSGGWNYNFENFRLVGEQRYIPSSSSGCNDAGLNYAEHQRIYRYRIVLPDGSAHVLHLRGIRGDELPNEQSPYWGDGFYGINMAGQRSYCAVDAPNSYSNQDTTGLLTYYTTDGSYLRLEKYTDSPYWFLYMPDGTHVIGETNPANGTSQVNVIYDSNAVPNPGHPEGNRVEFFYVTENGHPVVYIQDAYNRSIRIEKSYISNPRQDRITVAGPNGTLEWRVTWKAFTVNDQYGCVWNHHSNQFVDCTLSMTHNMVEYVQLPIGTMLNPGTEPPLWRSYKFTYLENVFGFLDSMFTPGGAQYRYEYGYLFTYGDTETTGITSARVSHRYVYHDGNPTPDHWSFIPTNTTSTVTAPDGGQTVYVFYDNRYLSTWYKGLVWKTIEPGGKITKRQWTRNTTYGLQETINTDGNNPYVERESVTLGNSISAITDYLYDKNGNLKKKTEYDWGTYQASAPMDTPGSVVRTTEWTYYVDVPDDIPQDASPNPVDAYWNSTAGRRLNAVTRQVVKEGSTVKAASEFEYDNPRKAANVTRELRWDSAKNPYTAPLTTNNSVEFLRSYSTDYRGNLTSMSGADVQTEIVYQSGSPYPVQVKYGSPGNGFRSYTYSWNFDAGSLNSVLDDQNSVSTVFGYDTAGRLNSEVEAAVRTTATIYDDENRTVKVKKDLVSNGDGLLQSMTYFDMLGRSTLVRSSDGAPLDGNGAEGNGIKVTTAYSYFTGGSRTITTTPYRLLTNGDTEAIQWTCTQKDQLGRVTAVAMFNALPSACTNTDNRTGITQTAYDVASSMARTRLTDPAGKIIDEYSDGLGRLKKVVENPTASPSYETFYSYDVLGNLATASQSDGTTTQQRTFGYTSLGRLASASNPETGVIQFTYEPWGDLKTRQDARGVTTTVGYDNLHRTITKTYTNDNNVTPDVTYTYHTTAPYSGQLHQVSTTAGTTTFGSYDPLGRVLTHSQQIGGGTPYNFLYEYKLSGALARTRYPSNRDVYFDTDNAGRLTKVRAEAPTSKTYADLTVATTPYTPDGRISQVKLGNDLWETREYRRPGTVTSLKLGTSAGGANKVELLYNFSATQNNGNLLSHVIRHNETTYWSQNYEYDGFNRLTCVTENTTNVPAGTCAMQNTWWQQYQYDRFGNRWVGAREGLTNNAQEFTAEGEINKTNNRLTGVTYDAVGNPVTYAPWGGLTWDAENRLLSMTSTSNGNSYFTYDAEGRRIKKESTIPTPHTTYFIYDAFGKLAAEYSTQTVTSGTSYLFADILGTPRAISGNGGAVLECTDYTPFGRSLHAQAGGRNGGCHQPATHASQQFTGQVRDQGTDLDYFGARYYSAAQGRWLTPDWSEKPAPVPYADLSKPQTLNLYQYVGNNPTTQKDADGHCALGIIVDTAICVGVAAVGVELLAWWGMEKYYQSEKLYHDARSLRMQKLETTDAFLSGDTENADLKRQLTTKKELQVYGDTVKLGSEVLGAANNALKLGGALTGTRMKPVGSATDIGKSVEKAMGVVAKQSPKIIGSSAEQLGAMEKKQTTPVVQKAERKVKHPYGPTENIPD